MPVRKSARSYVTKRIFCDFPAITTTIQLLKKRFYKSRKVNDFSLHKYIILLQLCIQVEGKVRPPAADSVIISSCLLHTELTRCTVYTVQEPPVFLPNYLPFQLPMYFIFFLTMFVFQAKSIMKFIPGLKEVPLRPCADYMYL